MHLRFILFCLLLTPFLNAAPTAQQILSSRITANCLPALYASMGTPLYESLLIFESYEHLGGMKEADRAYSEAMLPVYRHGMQLNQKELLSGAERKAYLQELRTLEAAKKRVMHQLTRLTMRAVDEDDYDTFRSLVAFDLDELLPTLTTRSKAINYYKSKPQGSIIALNKLAEQERKRKAARLKALREERIVEKPRDYRLVQHLPTATEKEGAYCESDVPKASDEPEEAQKPSALKTLGIVFKTLGVNFDPGLLEDYKTHKPPTVDDIP